LNKELDKIAYLFIWNIQYANLARRACSPAIQVPQTGKLAEVPEVLVEGLAHRIEVHCQKILFTTALRRIFAALMMEKPCLSTGAFFPAHIALFKDPIGRKKILP